MSACVNATSFRGANLKAPRCAMAKSLVVVRGGGVGRRGTWGTIPDVNAGVGRKSYISDKLSQRAE